MRELLAQMKAGLDDRDDDGFSGNAETLLIMMQQHNMKEENILYPMCDNALGGSDVGASIARGWPRHDHRDRWAGTATSRAHGAYPGGPGKNWRGRGYPASALLPAASAVQHPACQRLRMDRQPACGRNARDSHTQIQRLEDRGAQMHPNLSFEQAPPISVPYRFFSPHPGSECWPGYSWPGLAAMCSGRAGPRKHWPWFI
jgi:hypothetical protein